MVKLSGITTLGAGFKGLKPVNKKCGLGKHAGGSANRPAKAGNAKAVKFPTAKSAFKTIGGRGLAKGRVMVASRVGMGR
jgi:hypothetical protein